MALASKSVRLFGTGTSSCRVEQLVLVACACSAVRDPPDARALPHSPQPAAAAQVQEVVSSSLLLSDPTLLLYYYTPQYNVRLFCTPLLCALRSTLASALFSYDLFYCTRTSMHNTTTSRLASRFAYSYSRIARFARSGHSFSMCTQATLSPNKFTVRVVVLLCTL